MYFLSLRYLLVLLACFYIELPIVLMLSAKMKMLYVAS